MLEINNINIFYGKAHALKDVCLSVKENEIVTLIGNNGAGKTSLLNAISGIIPKASGTVTLNGQDISHASADSIVRRGVIHVPEGRRVFPKLTTMENLRLGAFTRPGKNLSEDYEQVFLLFPVLKERMNQLAGTLSGGEQQMLAVGRALMAHPKLLLLDEPSLGLAPVIVEIIYETIKKIHQRGTPVLLVEQNAFLALNTAQRGYVMETGQIVLSGNANSLLENPEVQAAYLGG